MLRNHILICVAAAALAASVQAETTTALDQIDASQPDDALTIIDAADDLADDESEQATTWIEDPVARRWWRKFRGRAWKFDTTASEKLEAIMEGVLHDTVSKPVDYDIETIFDRRMNQVTCDTNDALAKKKLIHQQGVVAPVEWRSTGSHDYTGMFQGAEFGVMRFSDSGFLVEGSESSNPSVALKFFRDYAESVNLLFQIDFNNQDSLDFFPKEDSSTAETIVYKPFTTHPPVPNLIDNACEMKTITRKLLEASNLPFATGTGHFAKVQTFAESAEQIVEETLPKFPFELQLVVNPEAIGAYTVGMDPLDYLTTSVVPSDHIPLFFALARADPDAQLTLVGEVYMTQQLTRSRLGDEVLHFQHENFRRDLAKLRTSDRKDQSRAWNDFEQDRQSSGEGKLSHIIEQWGDTPVPAMEDFGSDYQDVVESGIDGSLGLANPDLRCPFAWVLMQ